MTQIKAKFELDRCVYDEFQLYCKEHHLDFDETIRKLVDVEVKRHKELDKLKN